jgi:hypothetical protein
MPEELRPNEAEKEFLSLAYNRFYVLYDEIKSDIFWEKDDCYRFNKIRDAFLVYAEILNYPPMQWVFEHIKKTRPAIEADIGRELFKFIRNVMAHMPFFEAWNDVWINKNLVNWYKDGQRIDTFLKEHEETGVIKFRYRIPSKKKLVYLSIHFPADYTSNKKIFLKDILEEKEGVSFAVSYMRKIIDTQVERTLVRYG